MSVASMMMNSTSSPLGNVSLNGDPGPSGEPTAVKILRLLLQVLTFVIGVVGNIFVIIITSRKRNWKVVGNRFILHLAIADMGILLISFPIHVASIDFPNPWPFGEFVCRIVIPFTEIFFGVEIGCITAIAFYRYRMLVHCMKPQMTAQTANRILFLIWLLSFLIIVLPILFIMKLVMIKQRGFLGCSPVWPSPLFKQTYNLSKTLTLYYGPLVVIFTTFRRMRAKLRDNIRKHDSIRRSSLKERPRKKNEIPRVVQNRRAMKLLTPVVVVFVVCMAPINVYSVLTCFIKIRNFILLRFTILLVITNSSVNPIIYSIVNSEFRRDFARLLHCHGETCRCTDSTEGLSLSTFRRTSSSTRSSKSKRGSFLLKRLEGSSSSSRKSSKSGSRNSAEKILKASDEHE